MQAVRVCPCLERKLYHDCLALGNTECAVNWHVMSAGNAVLKVGQITEHLHVTTHTDRDLDRYLAWVSKTTSCFLEQELLKGSSCNDWEIKQKHCINCVGYICTFAAVVVFITSWKNTSFSTVSCVTSEPSRERSVWGEPQLLPQRTTIPEWWRWANDQQLIRLDPTS